MSINRASIRDDEMNHDAVSQISAKHFQAMLKTCQTTATALYSTVTVSNFNTAVRATKLHLTNYIVQSI